MITLGRLALVPFVLALTYSRSADALAVAAGLFCLAVVSDWLDGYMARKLKQFSRFGTILDPLVDKTLMLGLFFVLAHRDLIPAWVFLVLLFREFMVSAIRHGLSTATEVVGANWMGKTKFCLQTVVIAIGYMHLICSAAGTALPWGEAALRGSAIGMTVIACIFLLAFIKWHAAELSEHSREPL